MIIRVASGKGGTGKTTVAINLALTIGSNVQLLDCDVEQPNAHLFIHPVYERTETVTTPVLEIDMVKCTLCGTGGGRFIAGANRLAGNPTPSLEETIPRKVRYHYIIAAMHRTFDNHT